MKILCIFVIFAVFGCESSRILFIIPPFAKSHVVTAEILAKALAKQGHEVSFVSAFPSNEKLENFREIKIPINDEDFGIFDEINKAMSVGKEISNMLGTFSKIIFDIGNQTLQSTEVRNLMDNEKFDLVILGYFMNDFALGLADHFKCPSIVYFSGHLIPTLSRMVGNPISPESVRHATVHVKEMNFIGRLRNFMVNAMDYLVMKMYFRPRALAVYK